MFNSRKINNDPEPYIGWSGKRYEDSTYPSLEDGPVGIEPRPEYDNNPNPILEQFREDFTGDMAGWSWWLSDVSKEMFYSKECTREHIHHAKRVLEKLVNVYGV